MNRIVTLYSKELLITAHNQCQVNLFMFPVPERKKYIG